MSIIGSLPNIISDGQVIDAVPVTSNFDYIVTQVNANAVAATTLSLYATETYAESIGVGVTNGAWSSVSRSAGSLYTNAHPSPLCVCVSVSFPPSTACSAVLSVAGVGISQFSNGNISSPFTYTLFVIVPPGATYQLTLTGSGAATATWSEY